MVPQSRLDLDCERCLIFLLRHGRMQARKTRTGARGERRSCERRGRSPSEEKIRDCDRISDLAICRFSRLLIFCCY